jgi:hypothetical protein
LAGGSRPGRKRQWQSLAFKLADQLKAKTFATWNKVAESGWSALDKIKPLICHGDVELFRLKQRRDVFGQDHGSHFQGCKGGRWEEESIAAHRLPQD